MVIQKELCLNNELSYYKLPFVWKQDQVNSYITTENNGGNFDTVNHNRLPMMQVYLC